MKINLWRLVEKFNVVKTDWSNLVYVVKTNRSFNFGYRRWDNLKDLIKQLKENVGYISYHFLNDETLKDLLEIKNYLEWIDNSLEELYEETDEDKFDELYELFVLKIIKPNYPMNTLLSYLNKYFYLTVEGTEEEEPDVDHGDNYNDDEYK